MVANTSKNMIELINDRRGKINSLQYGEIVFIVCDGVVQRVKMTETLQVKQDKNQEIKNA